MAPTLSIFSYALILIYLSLSSTLGLDISSSHPLETRGKTPPLQDIVTWDQYSISVRGERLILLTGEFHPFRLPSPGLWLDVFQKIRSLGYSAVSFYLDWALLEGERGEVRLDGVLALDEFFDAATDAGIYLIARPGPYINSETSGGGFPGWLARLEGRLKTTDRDYLDAITPYISTVGRIVAKAQITKGGPVILVQPDNEYTFCLNTTSYTQVNNATITVVNSACLDKGYMAYVEDEYRKAGVVVPLISNDAFPSGNFAPGTGVGAADLYSFDFYPLGWSSPPADPSDWSALNDPRRGYNFTKIHQISPNTPFSISEFQGGSPDAWGGNGVEASAAYINHEFERVIYKINYGFRIAIQSLYMIFGGTNWGNLGHPSGYTSYDVGAAITENRLVTREKYSELKLQASFLQVSPAYLTSHPDNGSFGVYTNTPDLSVTALLGPLTAIYITRQINLTSLASTEYKLTVNSSLGPLTIPQLGGQLSLNGRDSKFHVVDYDVGGINLIYSTAEIFSWKKSGSKSILLLYGGEGETHEFALPAKLGSPSLTEGDNVIVRQINTSTVVQWQVDPSRRVISFGNKIEVHLLWRNDAYNHWVLDLPAPHPLGVYASPNRADKSVIVKAGYLVRSAKILGKSLYLTGDINRTTEIEIISSPTTVSSLFFNGDKVKTKVKNGRLAGLLSFLSPNLKIPSLEALTWRYIDSLPEITDRYVDSSWTSCVNTKSNNPRGLSTPTTLYAGDYGFNAGSLLYRGHFVASGNESSFYLLTEGGYAFGHSVWLNSTYLGSWLGNSPTMFYNQTLHFPARLQPGKPYVLTVLIDHMGLDQNFLANVETMKDPRGILDYNLEGREKAAISWKITGNLGGEHYRDLTRGPLNEGAMFGERQGYHLPGAPISHWEKKSPITDGINQAGVGFFATSFSLQLPLGYDLPISIVFKNSTVTESVKPYRVQFYINGWQFGKYVSHIGPQLRYPIPEGILNYRGSNYLALTLWGHDNTPVKVEGLKLEVDAVIQSGFRKPSVVHGGVYAKRRNTY